MFTHLSSYTVFKCIVFYMHTGNLILCLMQYVFVLGNDLLRFNLIM